MLSQMSFASLDVFLMNIPGENDGQMTMEYHGLPWSSMEVHGHTTMVNHGKPWSTMIC